MPKLRDKAWLDKLCVGLARQRGRPLRHKRLRYQLAVNRGKALGFPKPLPFTRFQRT